MVAVAFAMTTLVAVGLVVMVMVMSLAVPGARCTLPFADSHTTGRLDGSWRVTAPGAVERQADARLAHRADAHLWALEEWMDGGAGDTLSDLLHAIGQARLCDDGEEALPYFHEILAPRVEYQWLGRGTCKGRGLAVACLFSEQLDHVHGPAVEDAAAAAAAGANGGIGSKPWKRQRLVRERIVQQTLEPPFHYPAPPGGAQWHLTATIERTFVVETAGDHAQQERDSIEYTLTLEMRTADELESGQDRSVRAWQDSYTEQEVRHARARRPWVVRLARGIQR